MELGFSNKRRSVSNIYENFDTETIAKEPKPAFDAKKLHAKTFIFFHSLFAAICISFFLLLPNPFTMLSHLTLFVLINHVSSMDIAFFIGCFGTVSYIMYSTFRWWLYILFSGSVPPIVIDDDPRFYRLTHPENGKFSFDLKFSSVPPSKIGKQ